MKKVIAFILTLAMAFSLFAAHAEETQTPAEPEATAEEPVSETQPETTPEPEQEESLEELIRMLFNGEEDSAENAVLSLLSGLGIDTTGYEEKISNAVGDVKNAAGEWFNAVVEGAGSWLSQLSTGLDSLLNGLNIDIEQTKSTVASQVEKLRTLLEELVEEAKKHDPESELTKALTELLETAKGIAEDDAEAVTEVFNKLVEIVLKYIQ